MPRAFDECVKHGGANGGPGRIRTLKPRSDVYIYVCFNAAGKSHAGNVHHVGEKRKSRKREQKVHVGPRGGRYVMRENRKVYLKPATE